jgi:hydroxyacyl-ACP dehydratase HTD2-like protein with hotdog domain
MSHKLLTQQALDKVGQQGPVFFGEVHASDIAKFCSGIGEEGPEHHDEHAARAMGFDGIVAPPTFPHLATRPTPPRSGYLSDGQYDNVAPDGMSHLQTMLGGQDWTIHRLCRAGEKIEERRKVLSIDEREGKSGPLAIMRTEQLFSTLDGEPIETLVSTLIMRPPPPAIADDGPKTVQERPPEAGVAPDAGPGQLVVKTDMIQSFLFNAAIWAVHRIHWDVPYARSEGLPSTVLVGWNLANYVARLGKMLAPEGRKLHRLDLSYRAISHPGEILTVTAGEDDADGFKAVTLTSSSGATNIIGRMGWL